MTTSRTRKNLEKRIVGFQELRASVGDLLATFNRHKQHLTSDEEIHYGSTIQVALNQLDRTTEEIQFELDVL